MAKSNVQRCYDAVEEGCSADMEQANKTEEYVDYLNKEISAFITHCLYREKNQQASNIIEACFKTAGNIERIADHAMNICGFTAAL